MTPLLRAELTRITRRRGSFFGAIGITAAITVIAVIVILVNDPRGGESSFRDITSVGQYVGVFAAIVVGALAGSYDTANGTMRYLVLTGVPRWQLTLIRVPALMIALCALVVLPILLGLVVGATIGTDGGSAMSAKETLNDVWSCFAAVWIWGVVSLAVGTLMRSNGPAIAVGIVLFVAGSLITGLIGSEVSKEVANVLLPRPAGTVISLDDTSDFLDDDHVSIAGSFVLLGAWLAALLGLAVWRVRRDEY
ncbi:ABC transporter permease subunit [Patulibacter defluvii]|uniref:ABC transporter permease subunit n=1 Tax=Patulibacter defluvii TaxID=3095358 RepID=UPI002A74A250|nr:ABC transporter permease subunit [Patulibacter sp. DM4]